MRKIVRFIIWICSKFTRQEIEQVTFYKCPNDHCPLYLRNLDQLNAAEKHLRQQRSSQFSVRYIYSDYRFQTTDLQPAAPESPRVDLARIHSLSHVVGLILAFHISFGIAARILREIFQIPISYQTVLNYTEAAAFHCHRFNLAHKGPTDSRCAGDETYIKIAGKWHYTFLCLGANSHKITSYHVADTRDARDATIALNELVRTAPPHQPTEIIVDGNPAYGAAIHFLNQRRAKNNQPRALTIHHVLGLQNLDQDSEHWRPYKQLIERLIRTYRFHTRAACGFGWRNGAVAVTVLFVTYYNFLRPHMALRADVPVHLDEEVTRQGAGSPPSPLLFHPCLVRKAINPTLPLTQNLALLQPPAFHAILDTTCNDTRE